MNTMHSRQDATAYVEDALTNGGRNADFLLQFNVEPMLDELHAAAGSWDVDSLDTARFWTIVERHER